MLPRVDIIRADENDWLLLNNSDHISNFIKENGFWGSNEAVICKAFISKLQNPHILDIGANIGGFSVPIAEFIANKNGKVFSFEPQRIVFQQLCANLFINRLDNVYVFNCALGDLDKEIEIPELDFWSSQNIGGFSIDQSIRNNLDTDAKLGKTFANTAQKNAAVFKVHQKTLDNLGLDTKIDFIKVDVEGFELEFFRGARQSIVQNNFPPILFELWERDWYEEKANATKQFLLDLGYNFEQFGREILAQHSKFHIQCDVNRNGDNINLAMK